MDTVFYLERKPKMPLPKKVKVRDFTYSVERVKDLHRIDDNGRRHDYFGLVNVRTDSIQIEEEMSHQNVQLTLAHELVHAMLHQTPLNVHPDEEDICNSLAPMLIALIRDNPQLVEYFKEKK